MSLDKLISGFRRNVSTPIRRGLYTISAATLMTIILATGSGGEVKGQPHPTTAATKPFTTVISKPDTTYFKEQVMPVNTYIEDGITVMLQGKKGEPREEVNTFIYDGYTQNSLQGTNLVIEYLRDYDLTCVRLPNDYYD